MQITQQQPAETKARSGPGWALKIVSALTVALVLVQAVLAGRGWFVNRHLIDVHGVVGDVTLLVVLVQAGLALAAARRHLVGRGVLALNVVLPVLVFVQLVLGYSAVDSGSGTAASLHIPNGVLIFGLTVLNLALVLSPRRDS